MTTFSKIAYALGWAGVIPFLLAAFLVWFPLLDLRESAVRILCLYGGIIFSFLGGVHWGLELRQREKSASLISGYIISVIPSLVAFAAVFMPPFLGLMILSVGFVGMVIYDYRMLIRKNAPDWYVNLRIQLTTVVFICLFSALVALGLNT